MSRINRVPRGLQDLLGSTNQGDNPSDLLPDVRATFDIFPFWAVERLRVAFKSSVNPSTIASQFHIIPDNEMWLVKVITTTVTNTLAATLRVAFNHRIQNVQDDANPGTNVTTVGGSNILDFTTTTGLSQLAYSQNFDSPLILPPNTIMSSLPGYVENSNAAVAWTFEVVYHRLSV